MVESGSTGAAVDAGIPDAGDLEEILKSPGGVARSRPAGGWSDEEAILPMAAEALNRALASAGMAASEVTHLVTVS